MSDRCEKFVTMPTGSGYDDRCAVCGVPCEEHPSDKARCSHPSEDEKPIRFCHLHLPTRPPWKTDAYLIVAEVPGGRPGGEVIAQCRPTRSGILTEAQNKANAEFIVRMVNASLSPIALDFEAAKKTLLGAEWEFPKRVKDNLNAQLRTIVARVAQEEREKAFKEVMAEWTKPTIRTHAEAYQFVSDFTCWLQGKTLRGTP